MLEKKTLILFFTIALIIISIQIDGLTRKEVREKFRCALRKRRVTLGSVSSSSSTRLRSSISLSSQTSTTDTTTTMTTTTTITDTTTMADYRYTLLQSCTLGILLNSTGKYFQSKLF